jgi:hypothetical protein
MKVGVFDYIPLHFLPQPDEYRTVLANSAKIERYYQNSEIKAKLYPL